MLQKEGLDATIYGGVCCLPELGCCKVEVSPELGVEVLPMNDRFATKEQWVCYKGAAVVLPKESTSPARLPVWATPDDGAVRGGAVLRRRRLESCEAQRYPSWVCFPFCFFRLDMYRSSNARFTGEFVTDYIYGQTWRSSVNLLEKKSEQLLHEIESC